MKILIGSDHFGFSLKEELKSYLTKLGRTVIDIGVVAATEEVDYPDIAVALAERVAAGETDRGILICGTGIGMAIAANKIPGVRAACAHDPYSAERARKSNDAQILALGAQVIGPSLAKILVDHWLASEFGGGRSMRKIEKIKALDERFRKTE
jgi:ribose 5-phosphate isomerase B